MKFIRVIKSNKYQQLTFDDINKVEYLVTFTKLIINSDYIKQNIHNYQNYKFENINELICSNYIKSLKTKENVNIFCEPNKLIDTIINECKLNFSENTFYSISCKKNNTKNIFYFYLYQNKMYNNKKLLNKLISRLITFKKGYSKKL